MVKNNEILDVMKNMRDHIDGQGLKHKVVAEKAGISNVNLSEYLSGKSRMPLDVYIRICDVLQVPTEKFIGKEGAA